MLMMDYSPNPEAFEIWRLTLDDLDALISITLFHEVSGSSFGHYQTAKVIKVLLYHCNRR